MRINIKTIVLGVVLAFFMLNLSPLIGQVSAQGGIGISRSSFDRVSYDLGSNGTVEISVFSYGFSSYVHSCIVACYSINENGAYSFWGTGSGQTPPGNISVGETTFSYNFTTPTDTEIITGPIYYTAEATATQNGEEVFFRTILLAAHDGNDTLCVLNNPQHASYSRLNYDNTILNYDYQSLNWTYSNLQTSYNSLTSESIGLRNQVNSSHLIIYGLVAVAIFLLITTLYFAARPKVKLQIPG